MARITYVKKSQKPAKCERCGKDLPKGSALKHCTPRAGTFARGYKRIRCEDCPPWRTSETTSSPHKAIAYGATEAAEDAIAAWDPDDGIEAMEEIINTCAEGLREAAESYEESASNIENAFPNGSPMIDEIREKAEALNSSADDLETTQFSEWDPSEWGVDEADADAEDEDETDEDAEPSEDEDETPEDEEKASRKQAYDEARESWADSVRDEAYSAVGNVELP